MRARRFAAAALAAAALPWARAELTAQTVPPLELCVLADNPPMSAAQPLGGFEVDFARRLAAGLGREAELRWIPLAESPEVAVVEGRCAAALGAVMPDAMARERMVPGIALTQPYYAAGYALVRRPDAPPARSLAEVGNARIAVETESIPIYTLKQRGHRVYAVDDYDAVIRAVADGRAAYGYVWGPLAGWLLRDRSDVVIERGFEPQDRWHFALAVREEDRELRRRLDAAIRTLVEGGEVERIFARHGIPYLPPRPASAGPPSR